jgi:hypothetical protein
MRDNENMQRPSSPLNTKNVLESMIPKDQKNMPTLMRSTGKILQKILSLVSLYKLTNRNYYAFINKQTIYFSLLYPRTIHLSLEKKILLYRTIL